MIKLYIIEGFLKRLSDLNDLYLGQDIFLNTIKTGSITC